MANKVKNKNKHILHNIANQGARVVGDESVVPVDFTGLADIGGFVLE
ncbi:MAG TPA: hypothetical protein VE593_11625 [Nitrososphaeraceae archaeon]|nr:hypothetical protein [Nitrososphaeraceae archaeon]